MPQLRGTRCKVRSPVAAERAGPAAKSAVAEGAAPGAGTMWKERFCV